jgi:hypothetical protein
MRSARVCREEPANGHEWSCYDRSGQEGIFVISIPCEPTQFGCLTNNDSKKYSIIAHASTRYQSLDIPRPEAHRPADPDCGNRASADQPSDGPLRHLEDRGRISDGKQRRKSAGAHCRRAAFAERSPAVDERRVVCVNDAALRIGGIDPVFPPARATPCSGCCSRPGRKVGGQDLLRRFRTARSVSLSQG